MQKRLILLVMLFVLCKQTFAANEIVVAKDGSGQFTTIQEALNSISAANAEWKTILIKNGVYNEHVMIKCSYVALVGESRSGTHIEFSLPRAEWYAANGVNTGTGIINVAGNMHDIVIANMYVRNTYEGAEDYTEVIRTETGSTRLWFINLDVLCLWKDTFAPWGKAGGMYYVADCSFRGSIDAFCPRGYCYAINSRYTETKSSSPIWHEGVSTEDQKLVIQGGSVHSEYNKNVKLQNSQNYAKFYYLDLQMSDSITSLGTSATTNFYNVSGLAGLSWFANSINLADRKNIDAVWTFDSKWDPETTLPSVLPYTAIPQPYNGRYAVSAGTVTLKWISARNAVSHKVYFGTTEQPPLLSETIGNSLNTPVLEANKTYYWRVNTTTDSGELQGALWRFSTSDNINPVTPSTLTLIGKNNQNILIGNPIETLMYKMGGATQFTASGLPSGVQAVLKSDTIVISGTPQATGTYTYTVATTDALSNASVTGTFVVRNPNDTVPDAPVETDYTSTRLTKFTTTIDCKTMPQEPAWVVKSGSVSWSAGTGYKWGSTSAYLTLKVTGCTKLECSFTNTSTTRPLMISDGGTSNDKTVYPTQANVETVATFTPKTTGSDDIAIKTSGSSGQAVTKVVLYGNSTAIYTVWIPGLQFHVNNGEINSDLPLDVFSIQGHQLGFKTRHISLASGVYIIKYQNIYSKIIIN